jgi:hypothetical protein
MKRADNQDMPIVLAFGLSENLMISELPQAANVFLSNTKGKDIIAAMVKDIISKLQADLVIMATDSWSAEVTPAGLLHPAEMLNMGTAEMVERGWATRSEAISVVAQDRDTVYSLVQTYERDPFRFSGPIKIVTGVQSEFMGRFKFFGDSDKVESDIKQRIREFDSRIN